MAEGATEIQNKPTRRAAVLEGINRILTQFILHKSEEDVCRMCLAVAEELTSSRFGIIGELTPGGRLRVLANSVAGSAACQTADPTGLHLLPHDFAGHSLYGRVLKEGSFFANDLSARPDGIGLAQGLPPLQAFLGVPLIHAGKTIGVLAVADRPGGYREEDLHGLEMLAPAVSHSWLSKRAEVNLTGERELLQRIFDNIPVMLVIWDQRLQRFTLNPHAEAVLGWKTGDVNQGGGMSLFYPDQAYRRMVTEYMQSLEPGWRELTVATKEGGRVPSDWANVRLSDERMVGIGVDVRERKKAEEALRESEKQFRAIFEMASVGIMQVDPATLRFIHCNDRFCQITGYSRSELAQRSFTELTHPDDRQKDLEIFTRSSAGETPSYHNEKRYIRKDGSIIWVRINAAFLRNAQGRAFRTVAVCEDITESRRAEEELRSATRRLEAHFVNSPVAIVEFDHAYKIIRWSGAAERIFGWAADEMIGKSLSDARWVHDDDAALVARLSEELSAGRRPRNLHVNRNYRKDGTIITCEWYNSAIYDGCGRLAGVFSQVLDITERKQAEEALRTSERRYRTLFQSMEAFALMEPVLGKDGKTCDFRYLEINQAGARIRGATPHKLQGRTVLEMLPKIDRFWIKAYSQVARTEQPLQFERQNHVNGRWYRTYAYCPEKGKVASLIIDITDRKLAEQKLQELTRTLEQKVAERTDLAEARARQLQCLAVEMIEAEEKERRQLAELLHEDLQQILASARMQLQVVCASPASDPMLEEVGRLLEESIAKARSLSHELSPTVMHHSDLVAALQWLVRWYHERFGLQVALETKLEQQFVDKPIRIFLLRSVRELLFNVVKHAQVKKARVSFSRAGRALVIAVSDRGRGFDPAILDSESVKSGLGLLVLKERADYIGGSLAIESDPGQGSRFTLTVPLDLKATEKHKKIETLQQPDLSSASAEVSTDRAIRVLFADDHKVMRQGLIRLISGKPDISVVGEAGNGREAVELSRQLRPEVIVMDVSMPVMDGVEATRLIKAEQPDVRVIGLSMHDDEQIAESMRRAGAEAFVSKAASSSELLKAIYGNTAPRADKVAKMSRS